MYTQFEAKETFAIVCEKRKNSINIFIISMIIVHWVAPVAQWIERLFPKQKVEGSTPSWRALVLYR